MNARRVLSFHDVHQNVTQTYLTQRERESQSLVFLRVRLEQFDLHLLSLQRVSPNRLLTIPCAQLVFLLRARASRLLTIPYGRVMFPFHRASLFRLLVLNRVKLKQGDDAPLLASPLHVSPSQLFAPIVALLVQNDVLISPRRVRAH